MELHIGPLREVFAGMKDTRQWRWHDLGTVLTLVFLAVLSGENGLRGIAAWMQAQRWQLAKRLGLRGGRVPSYGGSPKTTSPCCAALSRSCLRAVVALATTCA